MFGKKGEKREKKGKKDASIELLLFIFQVKKKPNSSM